jgi:hypothetical protein
MGALRYGAFDGGRDLLCWSRRRGVPSTLCRLSPGRVSLVGGASRTPCTPAAAAPTPGDDSALVRTATGDAVSDATDGAPAFPGLPALPSVATGDATGEAVGEAGGTEHASKASRRFSPWAGEGGASTTNAAAAGTNHNCTVLHRRCHQRWQ